MTDARRRQRGLALVVVLWVGLLLSAMAGAFVLDTRTDIKIGWNMVETAKARAMADGAVALAIDALLRPETGFRPDGLVHSFAMSEGELSVAAEAEEGKVDLNAAPAELLIALLEALDVASEDAARLADAIEDWRDEDDLRGLNGAEDPDYEAAGLDYGAKDAPFEQVDELRQVVGMTDATFRALRPLVTTQTGNARIDALAAPRTVLLALPGMTADLADSFLAERKGPDPVAALALLDGFVDPAYLAPGAGAAVTVRAMATLANGTRFVREALLAAGRGKDSIFRIEAWREGDADWFAHAELASAGDV